MASRKSARKTHAEKSADRRKAILEAATEEFLEKGYEATVGGIMDRSGGSRATFYKEFGSKSELFKAVGVKRANDLLLSLGESWSEDGDLRQNLFRYARSYIAIVLAPETLRIHRSGIKEAENVPGFAKIFFETHIMGVVQPIARYLRRLNDNGSLHISDPDLAAQLFIVMVKGNFQTIGMIDIDQLPSQFEIDQHITLAVEMFVRGNS